MLKHVILVAAVAAVLPWQAQAAGEHHYVPPRAEEALAKPKLYPDAQRDAHIEAERVRYSVLIGLHDFDSLERESGALLQGYAAGKIPEEDFRMQMISMVPLKGGEVVLSDLVAWTKARPSSYAAWYVLGRLYLQLADDARRGGQTLRARRERAGRYGDLSWNALVRSVQLYAKPIPSYSGMIALERMSGPYQFGPKQSEGTLCSLIGSYFPEQLQPICPGGEQAQQRAILDAAIKADPNCLVVYLNYVDYGIPGWGGDRNGDWKHLDIAYEQAKKSGAMRRDYLEELNAYLIRAKAVESVYARGDYRTAAAGLVRAYDASPTPENVKWLLEAGDDASIAGDKAEAIRIYTKAIEARPDDNYALFQRGECAETLYGNHDRLFQDLIASAKLGNMYAQNNIGYYYMTGSLGFPVDLQQAKKWLTLAANQGLQHSRDKLPVVDAMIARESAKKTGK